MPWQLCPCTLYYCDSPSPGQMYPLLKNSNTPQMVTIHCRVCVAFNFSLNSPFFDKDCDNRVFSFQYPRLLVISYSFWSQCTCTSKDIKCTYITSGRFSPHVCVAYHFKNRRKKKLVKVGYSIGNSNAVQQIFTGIFFWRVTLFRLV